MANLSMVLSSGGAPVAAYQDVSNGNLDVLRCFETDCAPNGDTVTRLAGGDTGHDGSLGLGAAGRSCSLVLYEGFPVIAYRQQVAGLHNPGAPADCDVLDRVRGLNDAVTAIDDVQRRARLVGRHGLVDPFDTVEDAAGALSGLHSSDPATVYLAARARVADFRVEDLETALYDDRTMVRMLGMRRTLFVVPRDLAAVMQAACTRTYVDRERRRLLGLIADQDLVADPGSWMENLERDTLAALRSRGEATAVELTEDVPNLATRIHYGQGTYGISTRVLFFLATAGHILRARPRGTWVSTQYRWAPVDCWLGASLPEIDPDDAALDLGQRWLRAFGPGTETDLKWWTGWTLGRTRFVLQEVGAVEVSLDGGTGYLLTDDLDPVEAPEPRAVLLPGLDPTVMGWKERDWYLGEHAPRLFDRNGNAGPTIWWDGVVVGGWAQREGGEIALGLLSDVGSEAGDAIRTEAGRLETWLGEMRVTPRFRTPLERELRG